MQIGFIIFVCLTAATVHLKPAPLVCDLQNHGMLCKPLLACLCYCSGSGGARVVRSATCNERPLYFA